LNFTAVFRSDGHDTDTGGIDKAVGAIEWK